MLTAGKIVLYSMTADDAAAVNERRAQAARDRETRENMRAIGFEGARHSSGSVKHYGNTVSAGDLFPLVVVRVWSEETGSLNGQVLLDGTDTHWVTSVEQGKKRGTWREVDA